MTIEGDYPFSYENCDHNKALTDPDNIGVCMQCLAQNLSLQGEFRGMEEVENTYAVMRGLYEIAKALEDGK